jgi:phosphatidate phosphatase APP1
LARVVLAPDGKTWPRDRRDGSSREQRGWRNFFSLGCVERRARLRVGCRVLDVVTDRDGYLDLRVSGHGLAPGWHYVTIETADVPAARARVCVIGDDVTCGIVSDIDDTIIATHLPRPLIAAWNSFVVAESARLPVAGMAHFYKDLLRRHPGAPVFYISTGSWTTLPFVERFALRHGFPAGPMLLTDWGPTNTGWFRSGLKHKQDCLRSLARDFPRIRWWLIGDDGQHDPKTYTDFARRQPDHVAGLAIRELNPVEQVLAHGTWHELDVAVRPDPPDAAPQFRGPDGLVLWSQVAAHLDGNGAGPKPR